MRTITRLAAAAFVAGALLTLTACGSDEGHQINPAADVSAPVTTVMTDLEPGLYEIQPDDVAVTFTQTDVTGKPAGAGKSKSVARALGYSASDQLTAARTVVRPGDTITFTSYAPNTGQFVKID